MRDAIKVAVQQITSGQLDCLYAEDLDNLLEADFTLRDHIRMMFAEHGVEIEFSGKQQNERGVVIDIDEDRIIELQLDVNTLRFGQTVVRVRV